MFGLSELFLYGDEIRNPLPALTRGEECHIVSLRRRDGRVRQYGLMIADVTSFTGDRSGTLEGFLIDREPEERAARAESERDFAKKQRSSLALLLAAACRQTLSHISASRRAYLSNQPEEDGIRGAGKEESGGVPLPREAATADGQEDGGAGARERRLSVLPIASVLNDIYQIALTEAASAPPLSLPIESGRFLQSLCRQILPDVTSRGISLRCEISHDLPPRFSGPSPLLRHALERAILAVTAPVLGGLACIRASRDPNAPKSPGVERVLFSVSWTLFPRDIALGARNLADTPDNQNYSVSFEAEGGSLADAATGPYDPGVLDMADEQEVLRYLARRMRGELLEGNFTNDFRMISLIVPLAHIAADDREESYGEALPEDLYLATSTEENLDERTIASLTERYADVPIAALDVLAPDSPGPSAEYPGEEEDERAEPELDILLVDNNLNNRLLFSLFLRDTRHRITEAHDGQEGVEAFKQGRFDVIFLDMEMPLMDGYQATRIIRALEADSGRPATPIVAMTTYALPEFQRQCMLVGCTDFMSKPFNKIVLANVLEAFVQMKANKLPNPE